MDSAELTRQFAFGALTVLENVEGLTHEGTLVRPDAGGNCAHWILGHVVATRSFFFPLLGLDRIWPRELEVRYGRGSDPDVDPGVAVPLADLLDDFRTSQALLTDRLASVTAADLAAPAPVTVPDMMGRTVGSALLSFAWHEAYHAGQLALLRRQLVVAK